MNSKIVPGPWYAEGAFVFSKRSHVGKEQIVCDCGSSEEGHAHAKLIAVLPKLLFTCKGAATALRKALLYLPADDEAVFCGEWLGELENVLEEVSK